MLHVVGQSNACIFGMKAADRLQRQAAKLDVMLVADAGAVLDDVAVQWLAENPGNVIASDSGKPLAVVAEGSIDEAAAALAGNGKLPVRTAASLGEHHIRKLRRKSPVLALSLDETPRRLAERVLFEKVYKGVTDVVTKYVWPEPALAVTRVATSLGLTPNAVTILGIVLMVVASWQFYVGAIGAGLAAAWAMTFFDTVDGKLARVTVTSSRLGNWLDHGTDIVHPPVWWYCLAVGLQAHRPLAAPQVWTALWVVLGAYVVGRLIEVAFHRFFGFNQYIWRPFDSRFRLIVSRRNIILLIMSVGLLVGRPIEAFVVCAAWSAVSTLIQAVRIAQAFAERRQRPVTSWLA